MFSEDREIAANTVFVKENEVNDRRSEYIVKNKLKEKDKTLIRLVFTGMVGVFFVIKFI